MVPFTTSYAVVFYGGIRLNVSLQDLSHVERDETILNDSSLYVENFSTMIFT